jgi:DNA invertase Pin-like site-specific DNA recombinase
VLIGFYDDSNEGLDPAEENVLRDVGCERIFSAGRGRYVSEEVIEFLRPGDTLVVHDISRLAGTIKDTLFLVERLHKSGVSVHALRNNVVPGTAVGDSFGTICAILADTSRNTDAQDSADRKSNGQRGRPASLSAEDQARAERLLQRASVLDVARLLRVSPATIYRYFPRRRNASVYSAGYERMPPPKGQGPPPTSKK